MQILSQNTYTSFSSRKRTKNKLGQETDGGHDYFKQFSTRFTEEAAKNEAIRSVGGEENIEHVESYETVKRGNNELVWGVRVWVKKIFRF